MALTFDSADIERIRQLLQPRLDLRYAATQPMSWIPLTLLAGYSNAAGAIPAYGKDALGFVHLRGIVTKSSALVTGDVAGTLPAGFRPAFLVAASATGFPNGFGVGRNYVDLEIGTGGDITFSDSPSATLWSFSLDGVAPFTVT